MKNPSLFRRILSMVLVFAMLASLLVPVASAEPAKRTGSQVEELTLTPIDPDELGSLKLGQTGDETSITKEDHALTDMVRVSIVLEKASTIGAGFEIAGIAGNAEAKAYRADLRAEQDAVTAKIEQKLGGKLNVKWNLTLAANCISADVLYGQIPAIKSLDGVKDVFLETCYEPQTGEKSDEPNNGSASHMIGSNITWAAGLTGAGSKLAVIDTGTDTSHQSFSGEALEYALRQNAEEKGMTYEDYVESLNLLTAEKIDALKDQLNAPVTGEQAYLSTKLPFNYSYVDKDYDVTHENDEKGEHGSHVAGISTANRFVKVGEDFLPALELIGTDEQQGVAVATQGVAPDAQLLTMKVFGNGGGAFSSDYMVAIEDAIILGCDSANLSLGSSAPGFGFSDDYENVLNELIENGMLCSISAGNSGMWYGTAKNSNMYAYLYADDVSFHTGGSPGTYANALTVASSDNVGKTGKPLLFGERHVFCNETSGYGNEPIATLAGTEYEYILIDGPGVDDNNHVGQEGDQFFALGSEVLTGKIAMCYRGTSSFFAKANAAAAQGAIGVIIINNQPGTINMNLTDYKHSVPVVSIMQADGNAIKESSASVTDDAGNVRYYTGVMSISEEMEISIPEQITDTVQVSSFSSYGVPGTLLLKPEILAPGGSIYSVNGYNLVDAQKNEYAGGHDQYELMSGTSMAAPQVNGMAALLGQYIREKDLCNKTGLSQRQLTTSLLMSTAHPVFDADGDYWPTIRVGAGHANVADAVAAQSYIMMDESATLFPDSAKDGKIKAELGDDPERTGKYDFSFTITPFEGKKEFTLRTDIFTQGIAGNGGYGMLQDTATMLIGADVTYEINGETYENTYRVEADVNMDGETTAADAQAILDHITGEEKEGAKFDAEVADVDGDGKISTYDAKLLLDSAESPIIEVSETTKVTVHIELDQDKKAELLENYFTKGFYVEGYTYVDPVADAEGSMDVVHSIPILGFCGSWSDPSMFERTSAIDDAYGTGKRPYVADDKKINYMQLKDEKGNASIYMGNPYAVEETFPAERLALNSQTSISAFNYLNIRNASTIGFAVQNEAGEVVMVQSAAGRTGAYYHTSNAKWMNTSAVNYTVGKKLASADLKEGDKATIGFYALPEYYSILAAKNDSKVDTDGIVTDKELRTLLQAGLIGDGAAIKYTVTVDDTAPVVQGAFRDLISGNILVKAADNNYIAYVAVTNKSGSKVFAGMVPEQTEAGQTIESLMELEGQELPDTLYLLVADYAGNESVFTINSGSSSSGGDDKGGLTIAFTSAAREPGTGNRALQIDIPNLTHSDSEFTGLEVYSNVPFIVQAAEYVDGYVFMASEDGWFYVAQLNSLDETQRVGRFSNTTSVVYDMAFNYQDGQLYVLGANNRLYTMDFYTGALTEVAHITVINPHPSATEQHRILKDLAIDDEGNFYSATYGLSAYAYLYKFNLAMIEQGAINDLAPVANNSLGVYNVHWGGCMAWDHNTDQLYMISNYWSSYLAKETYNGYHDRDNCLYVVNTETGSATRANNAGTVASTGVNTSATLYNACSGLIIVPGSSSFVKPTDTATSIELEPVELQMFKGQTLHVEATVMPWILTDKSVTWSSADESIAVVQDGDVIGVEIGQTTVTATTVAQPNLSVSIPVNVVPAPEVEIRGIAWNEESKGMAAVFKSNDAENWEGIAEVGQFRWGAKIGEFVYGSTDSNMFKFDADTYEVTTLGSIASDWIPSDAATLPADLAEKWGTGGVVAPVKNGTYLALLNPETGKVNYWDLSSYYTDDSMALIAYVGRTNYTGANGTVHENCAQYFVMTESGMLWKFYMNEAGSLIREQFAGVAFNPKGVADVTNSIWGSMVYDEQTQMLFISYYQGEGNLAQLYAVDTNNLTCCAEIGNFREKVWPVVGLYQYQPLTDLTLVVDPTELVLLKDGTVELNIKIKLGETNEYTVAIEDPSICSFENGVVTGLKAGETTLTVTTVDVNDAGEHLSQDVKIRVKEVKHIKTTVGAQVTDANGARFTTINLDGAIVSAEGTAAPGNVTSGARGGNIYLAEIDKELHILDAETFTATDSWNGVQAESYTAKPAMDMANYPSFHKGANLDENKFIFTTKHGSLFTSDYQKGYEFDLPDMAGICFAGVSGGTTTQDPIVYKYYVITTAGSLYELDIKPVDHKLSQVSTVETGITFEKAEDASIAFIDTTSQDGEEISGIVVADNGSKKIYFIDFKAANAEDLVNLIGVVDAENVSGLIGSYDNIDYVEVPKPPHYIGEVLQGFYFENDPIVEGWKFIDSDGDSHNWTWTPGADKYKDLEAYEGVGMIISNSWMSGVGALTPDNWAVSPAFDLTNAADDVMFTMYAKGHNPSWSNENFMVYVGTTDDVAQMQVLIPKTTTSAEWTQYSASLADYIGEANVYVAIRHFDTRDRYYLDLDMIEIMQNVELIEPKPIPQIDGDLIEEFNFETDPLEEGWTFIDGDGDNNNWIWTPEHSSYVVVPAQEGTGCLVSESFTYAIFEPLTPDNWAISPAIDLSNAADDAILSFYIRALDETFSQEHFAIYAGTSADIDSMSEIMAESVATGLWTQHTVSLADYVGEPEIYIAVRHFNCTDQYLLMLDKVQILENIVSTGIGDTQAQSNTMVYVAEKQIGDGSADFSVAARSAGSVKNESEKAVVIARTVAAETAKPAAGSTQAIKGELKTGTAADTFAVSDEHTEVGVGTVKLILGETENVTNGLLRITYDPEILTYVDCVSDPKYYSVHNDGEGTILYAYASKNILETGFCVMNFTFDGEVDTEIKIETVERNKDLAVEEEPLIVAIKGNSHVHAYGEPEWKWNDEQTEATATFTCECGDVQTLEAEITTEETPAAPHVAGEKKVIAKVIFNEVEYTDEKVTEIPALPCPCAHFTDMPEYGTVEHAAIDWAFTHDPQITNGMDETTFRPDVIVNRGQAMTFLWRAKEKPAPANTENPFTDVEEGRFFYDAVLWAVNCDPQITNGVTETTFAPFKTCNRAEILTFLWRTMGTPEPEGECPYSDVDAERYFAKAATWAYENGIYKGADGLFQPTEDCTRSDVVVFLYRYFTHEGLAE